MTLHTRPFLVLALATWLNRQQQDMVACHTTLNELPEPPYLYVIFQIAEVAAPRWLYRAILQRIRRLRPREPVPT